MVANGDGGSGIGENGSSGKRQQLEATEKRDGLGEFGLGEAGVGAAGRWGSAIILAPYGAARTWRDATRHGTVWDLPRRYKRSREERAGSRACA